MKIEEESFSLPQKEYRNEAKSPFSSPFPEGGKCCRHCVDVLTLSTSNEGPTRSFAIFLLSPRENLLGNCIPENKLYCFPVQVVDWDIVKKPQSSEKAVLVGNTEHPSPGKWLPV